MRILQVIQELRVAGAERVVAVLAEGARSAGHEVAVAAASGPLASELGSPIFPLPLLKRRAYRIPVAVWAVRRALQAWPCDLVHCHNPGMALVVALATMRGRRPLALVTVHGGIPDDDYRDVASALRWSGLPAVACGPGVASALRDQGYRVRTTIENGVSAAPQPANRRSLERDWALPPDRKLIVAIGRLVPQKNFGLAIRALAHVPGAALAIVGEGPLRSELGRLAIAAGVDDRVIFTGFRDDARQILGAADAAVIPSLFEGLPLVALEALAAGTPVVASSARGLDEFLSHDEDSLLVAPTDHVALAAALRAVLTEPRLAARLSEAGHRLATKHTAEIMVRRYLDLYREIAMR